MLIQTNVKKSDTAISKDAADEWLKQHPERTAEHLTGKLASNSVIAKSRQKTTGVVSKSKNKSSKTGKIKTKGPTAVYNAHLANFRNTLMAGEVVRLEDFKGRSKQSVLKMVTDLRGEGFDILTISRINVAIAWVLPEGVDRKLKRKGD